MRARRWVRPHPAVPHRYFANRRCGRQREINFVDEFFARVTYANPDPNDRLAIRLIAAASLAPAGYRIRRIVTKRGTLAKPAAKQVEYLLHMPRIQAALEEKFVDAGLTHERAAAITAQIAEGTVRVREQVIHPKTGEVVELERDVAPAERLRALDLRFRLTTGFAPSKSANVNANVPPDRFFDPEEWERPAGMATGAQEPRNVTPPRGAP